MCGTEWESFIKTMDIGITPWLVCRVNGSLAQDIRVEATTIFAQVTSFLEKCSQVDTGFHRIVDADARNYLHTFLLRKVAPLIQTVDSFSKLTAKPVMVGDDATMLALSVIKSMSCLRYLSFKKGDWAKRASDLLAEAFTVPKSPTIDGCWYIGGYLHHPVVRLEALRSLVDVDANDGLSIRDYDSISSSGVSTITPVSIKSGNVPPKLSLFSRK